MRISQLLALPLFLATLATAARAPTNSVLLSNIQTLTLRSGQKTTARRVSAIPQLACVGGNAKGLYEVDVLRCKNAGSDYSDENVQWTCQASLPPDFKLGATDVICEGYSSPDDPYVLKGSCGVEYRLVLTAAGEAKYGRKDEGRFGAGGKSFMDAIFPIVFWALFIGVIALILRSIWTGNANNNRRPPNFRGGWGGGGGFDDGSDDPPPPYAPRAAPKSSSGSARQQGWQPGFWTGAAAGAAGGYLAGNRNRTDPQVGSSRWTRDSGGSGGGGRGSSPSPSSSRYESTGFGGTSRR